MEVVRGYSEEDVDDCCVSRESRTLLRVWSLSAAFDRKADGGDVSIALFPRPFPFIGIVGVNAADD
jgi:hypothetical protein